MKFPSLLEEHRLQLFQIIELARENGGVHQTFNIFWDGTGACNFNGQTGAFRGEFRHLVLMILNDCGYAKYVKEPEKSWRYFALTSLALDYYDWWHRPLIYRTLSGWWASLEGEVKGVIIALVVPPLAGILFELARHLMRGLLIAQ